MSKTKLKPGCLISIAIILILIGICSFDAYTSNDPIRFASRAVRVKIPKETTVIIDDYSEASFPTGDRYSWTVLQIPSNKISEFKEVLKNSSDWKPLPVTKELVEHENFIQPTFMLGVQGEMPIKSATGYYIFIDEQIEEREETSFTEMPFYERPSFNFRFGLFDDRDGRLYIWSIDT